MKNNERRVHFKKGKQRAFLDEVIRSLNCPSLRALNQFGFDVPYASLKNYYTERRVLPESLFRDLCFISKIKSESLKVKYLDANWGQVRGGKN